MPDASSAATASSACSTAFAWALEREDAGVIVMGADRPAIRGGRVACSMRWFALATLVLPAWQRRRG